MFFQPGLLLSAILQISCTHIGGEEWISGDLNKLCADRFEITNLAMVAAILSIEIMVPIVILMIISYGKKKNLLNCPEEKSSFKYIYGYFYIDYKDSCFYWEFVRIL